MIHTVNQLKDHCDGLGAIINRLKNLSDNDEPYELMKHFIDSLNQQWEEINHEAALENIVRAAGESCCNAEELGKDCMFTQEQVA